MSAAVNVGGRKRKRNSGEDLHIESKTERKLSVCHSDTKKNVLKLEREIQESQQNWNKIVSLLDIAREEQNAHASTLDATLSLCKVFCRFFSEGTLNKQKHQLSEREAVVLDWLHARLLEYLELLRLLLRQNDLATSHTALSLCLELAKMEIANAKEPETAWKTGTFKFAMQTLLGRDVDIQVCQGFGQKYAKTYDDIRQYTLWHISQSLQKQSNDSRAPSVGEEVVSNCLQILVAIGPPPESKKFGNFFSDQSQTNRDLSFPAQRKLGQRAWLAVLNKGLDRTQQKQVLRITTSVVVPWFHNTELLMDFLTDSFEIGGSTALLALSGLFFLMQERNLDYPAFYTKLYSLLDENVLHSKHRSRFFRLLNTFMSSTHLPAALVASFIKRLSRLAVHGPPAAIVAIVPWVYNMLKSHPTCTFMIHREPRTEEERKHIESHGTEDPYNFDETDPMETNAIDSCLWELETLQSHYHPNVASLAKIISEQFTKSSYNLDDFLDHSYATLIDAELGRNMKKTPVVEYEIPKKVFVQSDGNTTLEALIEPLLEEQ